ncbi:hypothetical protein HBI25_037670 [Parastagonospora nodorum]|nr:hypothetical protein HBI09_062420 [Parastagonospora nodorum]KAH5009054.1 hypothetical protein HBI77_100110 [Parastagonospora nodorum]KAH5570546.1 hypothetical protein HBI25_037670 [Parastagonospora nodorum]KAH5607444.1 hypothetical protein HBI26_044390 [Parastagonospora nodorum]KAH5640487.1 hypothetical protein HBI51_138840 [Parastagonospora nodorum]
MFHPPSHNAPTHDLRYTPITCSHQTQTPLRPAPFPSAMHASQSARTYMVAAKQSYLSSKAVAQSNIERREKKLRVSTRSTGLGTFPGQSRMETCGACAVELHGGRRSCGRLRILCKVGSGRVREANERFQILSSGNAYNWRNEDPVVYRYPKRWGILQAESTTG